MKKVMAPPCHDFRTESHLPNVSDWTAKRINTRKACCEMVSRLFNITNLEAIMKIMTFSLGQPLPRPLKTMEEMTSNNYQEIFPSTDYINGLGNMRYFVF